MDTETQQKLTYMAREIAHEMCRNQGAQMLPATTVQACGAEVPVTGCENLLYAPITTNRFYRSGRTDIDVVLEGKVPVVPGASVLLSQAARPPWPTGRYSLRYRLANNGTNHDEIEITWFIDDEPLDTKHHGSEIYNGDGTVIGDGLLPMPLAEGKQCCVGGNNRLKVRIRHTGNNNQIENIRLFVQHGKLRTGLQEPRPVIVSRTSCCSSCAVGQPCDCGHGDHK